MKIMLDAGHFGLSNQSPVVPEYYESKRMWKLCEILSEELKGYGFEVFKTRDDEERDLSLVKRGEKAKGCDLFISLHSNAVWGNGNEQIDRVDVFAPFDNVNNSHELGNLLADAVAEVMGVSYGNVKTQKSQNGNWEYYSVLYGARSVNCPYYYIIEHSFHTNKNAAIWLLDDDNLKKLAAVEAKVIAEYFGYKKNEKGDVNLDGKLDDEDHRLVKRAVLNQVELTEEQKTLADMNEDSKVNAIDYMLLKRKIDK